MWHYSGNRKLQHVHGLGVNIWRMALCLVSPNRASINIGATDMLLQRTSHSKGLVGSHWVDTEYTVVLVFLQASARAKAENRRKVSTH